jgi:HNH endonuclease/AP2 domain
VKFIPLRNTTKLAVVDAEDQARILAVSRAWYCHQGPGWAYAKERIHGEWVPMHRFILDAPPGKIVDHVNGVGLDNRKENLRLCTTSQNSKNHRRHINNTSGYRGVSMRGGWRHRRKKWVAQINDAGKRVHPGYYATAEEASAAVEEYARKLHGAFYSERWREES